MQTSSCFGNIIVYNITSLNTYLEQTLGEQASEEQPESQDGEQEQEEEEKYIPRLLDAAGNVNTYLRNKMQRNYCILSCRKCNPAIKRSDP